MLRQMLMRRLVLGCFLIASGAMACLSGGPDGNATAQDPSIAMTSTPTASDAPPANTATGKLVMVADPCVGGGLDPATHYYPVTVSVRRGNQVVFHKTVEAGREQTVVLPAGTYAVSAPYDGTVLATLAAGSEAKARLMNGCKVAAPAVRLH